MRSGGTADHFLAGAFFLGVVLGRKLRPPLLVLPLASLLSLPMTMMGLLASPRLLAALVVPPPVVLPILLPTAVVVVLLAALVLLSLLLSRYLEDNEEVSTCLLLRPGG